MIREITIETNPYNDKINLFKESIITFESGITVLVGCNGSGKTTILEEIKSNLNKEHIQYVYFDNLNEGGSNARSKAGYFGDMEFLVTSMCSSEGENIIMNISVLASKIGTIIRTQPDTKELWILLDSIDSGLSIDNILEIKDLFNLILSEDKDIFIIISANEYEITCNENCYDVSSGTHIKFNNYDEYKDLILKSRQYKDYRISKKR